MNINNLIISDKGKNSECKSPNILFTFKMNLKADLFSKL